jgi:mitochondrial fission protein ELM1
LKAWLLTDGAAGNLRQAETLAGWLAADASRIDVRLRLPWAWVSPAYARAPLTAVEPELQPPWPELAIGCGRRGAAALDALPDRGQGGPLRVQILDPRCAPTRFDALIVPEHDRLRGPNVVTLTGSLNSIDDAWLASQREAMDPPLDCPSPRTLLLVGGPRRGTGFGHTELAESLRILQHWQARDAGCLWIALSRRTPLTWRKRIASFLPRLGSHRLWRDASDGPNPYPRWLANADRIVVTPDSVNMLSEACATGTPVLTHAPHGVRGRLGDLHRALLDSGRLRPLKLSWQPWTYTPLREGPQLVDALRELLGQG